MTIREQTEQIERDTLASFASLACASKGRQRPEKPCDIRTCYSRDRDRILHCKAFRRLKRKTQVFLTPQGDHYRTRLTHTLEVAQIARTVARALRLNEDLAEAIALGHDLGHTPFGHAGEAALADISGLGFTHFEQSVRVVTLLERGFRGLNLSCEVIDGIANHTRGSWPATLEGQVVRYADKIAYLNHDIEDAVLAGVLEEDAIPRVVTDVLGLTKSERITTLICALLGPYTGGVLAMAPREQEVLDLLNRFMFERVYLNPVAKREESKVHGILKALFDYYCTDPTKLPCDYYQWQQEVGAARAVTDYIAGMSDEFAIDLYNTLFVPAVWKGLR